MIIYNVTNKVDDAIHESWLQWMQQEHIPEVMATGCFTSCRILRILEVDDADGPTYAVQYTADDKDSYDRYIESFAPELRKRAMERWKDRVFSFRSLMAVVN